MNRIYISNSQSKVDITPIMRGLVRRVINGTLKYEDFGEDAEVSVTFTDNEGIRELNRNYRNIDRETDVLSFPLLEDASVPDGDMIADDEEEEKRAVALGDIVVSLEKASSQAEEYGHSFERELAFLCVHSMLHLLGYDHETGEDDERQMFFKQDEILRLLDITR